MQVELAKRHEAKITIICMVLLALAAGYVLLTRPYHRIEGDFLEREDRRVADEWLLSQLKVTIAEQRARACLALGRIGDLATLKHLIAALKDQAASVRAAAAFAIGVMEDTEALEALGRKPDPAAAIALVGVLEDDDRAVVANAVEALGKLGFADVAVRLTNTAAPYPITLPALARLHAIELAQWIAGRLKSDDQDNRWAAALALNALEAPSDEGITRSFLNLTRDRDASVRAEVVTGLARSTPSQEVFDALVRMTADPDPKVRIAAFRALGVLRYAGTFEVLAQFLRDRNDPNENVAAAAIDALANLGDRQAIPLLASLPVRASIVSYRAQSALAVLSGEDPSWMKPLRPLPEAFRTPAGIRSAADALSRSPAPQAVEFLSELWNDKTPEIRAARPAILRALSARGVPDIDRYLDEALASGDAALAIAAIDAMPSPPVALCRKLFESNDAKTTAALQLSALDAAARSVNGQAAQAGEAQRFFLAALDAADRPVRIRAVKYLRQIYNEDHDDKIGLAGTRYESQGYQRIARTVGHRIQMETSDGVVDIALDYQHAALTAENFVELVRKGVFVGQRFVEVVPLSFLRIDSPARDASSEPLPAVRPEINNQLFLRGSLGMDSETCGAAGCQFFISLSPLPLMDGRYTNFGRLVSGDDLLDRLTVETRILSMKIVE